jgi:valyl-tRNA synthetase
MDKKYDHIQSETQAQELWIRQNTYTTDQNPGPLYTVDTPPPTVSGSLHIGHVFSYTQTDIIARYKRMSGFSVFYPFGFDDNGLPTERFVEKKHAINAHSMTRSAFIDLCLKETAEVEKEFEKLWRRIGLSVDWSLSYSTMDARSRKISQESFIELYTKGYVYRKDEPALYCTNCRTTVAQAELDDAEKTAFFNDIIFKTADNQDLVIGTTRPELLPSVNALFYHPEDKRYQHLKGLFAIVPIFNQHVPILENNEIDPEKGTGLVMSSTFGDKADIAWYKKYNLSYRPSFGLDGKWLPETGPLAGLRVAAAREKVLKILAEQNLLVKQVTIVHTVNVHERCKKEIEYLVLPQWFLRLLPFKQEFLALADTINWYPAFMKTRYNNWVENLNWDWCLSRQRFYGIPFPAWHCADCGTIVLAEIKDLPVDPQETSYKGVCPQCKYSSLVPDTDVMDTWNTSSLTPYICLSMYKRNSADLFHDKSQFIPMSMRPQAHDIIRTWAFYTIVKSWMHQKTIPWKNIVISGHVLSTEKIKISKSQGNAPLAPETILSAYPADAIRYWTAVGTLGYDMAFSENQIKIGQKLLVKIWNAFRFMSPYLEHYSPTKETPAQLGVLNEWLLQEMTLCYRLYTKYFELNEFSLALSAVDKFFWHEFCDNYLELIKDQFVNESAYTKQSIDATRWTLYSVGLRILQLYSPFIPHIAETVYGLIYQKHEKTGSVHQTRFTDIQKAYSFELSRHIMSQVLAIVAQVRKLKTENQLSLKTELSTLTICSPDVALQGMLQGQELLIKGITRAHSLAFCSQTAETASLKEQNGQWSATIIAPKPEELTA